jgi:hypothetical protein
MTIMNAEAWEKARDASIKANATTGRNRRWIAADESRVEVEKFLFHFHNTDGFLGAMSEVISEWGHLTEKQEAAVRKIMVDRKESEAKRAAEREAERAAAADCPEGRIALTGVIVSTDLRESAFGTTWKMLFKSDDGFKLWGTVPTALFGWDEEFRPQVSAEEMSGKRVSFTAAVTPSSEDEKFGFFKRPTKAEWVA